MLALALAAAAVPAWPLTPDGWGPVKIGMTQKQVAAALHARLTGEAIEDENICVEKVSPARPGMFFMFEEGRLTRISIGEPSKVITPRGIGIGAAAAEVRRTYGKGLQSETHHYVGKPAEYLTYWTRPGARGVRFETDDKRRVETIHAGGPSIEYIEGCA
jgi:hypothetical protein